MKGQYGIHRVIQVLLGDDDPVLQRKGLTELSTYGILKECGAPFLTRLFNALIAAGCVALTDDDYRLASLTPKGLRVVLRQEADFTLPWPESPGRKAVAAKIPTVAAPPSAQSDNALFTRLKAWRKRIADARRFPVYRVMSNKTLMELARVRPETLDAMRKVKGIGPLNLAKYGEQILRIIAGEEE